jgi:hypothetical protein
MLARLALRLAAIEALAPSALAATGPWSTMAGPRVYDSRQDPIDGLDASETRALLVVYTEADIAKPYGSGQTRPDDTTVDLIVEAMIATRGSIIVDQPDGSTTTVGSVDQPVTDQYHEALVDMLEATVRRRLLGGDADDNARLFRQVAVGILHVESVSQRVADRTIRLAGRTMTFKCKVRADTWPTTTQTGLSRLPEPLASVAKALPAGAALDLCTALAASVPAPVTAPALVGVDLYVAGDRTPNASNPDTRARTNF